MRGAPRWSVIIPAYDEAARLFEEALLVKDVRFLTTRTIYNRIGDLVAWLSLALTAAALLADLRGRYASRW